jgi:hypothetical protein
MFKVLLSKSAAKKLVRIELKSPTSEHNTTVYFSRQRALLPQQQSVVLELLSL